MYVAPPLLSFSAAYLSVSIIFIFLSRSFFLSPIPLTPPCRSSRMARGCGRFSRLPPCFFHLLPVGGAAALA